MSPSLAYRVPETDTSASNALFLAQRSMQGAHMQNTTTLGLEHDSSGNLTGRMLCAWIKGSTPAIC